MSVVEVVERQLQAYNRKDAKSWAQTYALDAVQQSTDGDILAVGREDIEANIAARFTEPDLYAELISRQVFDNVVVDHERITRNFPEGRGSVEMLCIYTVENELIQRGIFKVFNKTLTP